MESTIPPVLDTPLLLLDYDGTLAPIQQDPMQAFPHADAPPLLKALNEQFPLWIVTGRHLNDLGVLLDLQLNAIGLHGLQKGKIGTVARATLSSEVREDIERMRMLLPEVDQMRVEEKEYTFAVHYRGATNEEPIVSAIKEWLENLPDSLNAIWGKKVVELKPKGISKGSAIQELLAQFPERKPLYIGDDTTDESAFEILHQTANMHAVTIKVGDGATCARYRVPDVESVIEYLKQYV